MDKKQFYDTVVKMRMAQRDVARSNGRDKDALQRARDYERIIDQEIKRVQIVTRETISPRLNFD